MKVLKNLFKVTICLVLVLSLVLTGCKEKEKETTTAKVTTAAVTVEGETTTAAPAAELEFVELSWYVIGNGQPDDQAAVETAVNAYIKDKINASIKITCFDWGSYTQKLQTMSAAGEAFDICFTSSWANNYFQQAAKGAFIPLNDYFTTLMKGAAENVGPDFLSGSAINGVNFALPANKEKPHQWGFIFRTDLVEKYSLDINAVKSLADVEPLLAAIKAGEPDVYPLEATAGNSPFLLLDFDRVGDDKYPGVLDNDSADMKVYNEFEGAQTLAYFQQVNAYYNAGYIREDAATVTDQVADENAGKIFCATVSLKPGKDAEMTNSSGYPWTQVAITPAIISNRDTTGSMQAISSTSKNPERAAMFLELFSTDPVLNNMINFGVEGTHYTKVDDKTITLIDGSGYNPGTAWMFGNQFINFLLPNEDPEKWAKFMAFNDAAAPTKSLGLVFDAEPVKTEIAQCNVVWDQYMATLQTGTVDPADMLDEFIAGLADAGSATIIAEKQAQLDAWLAAK